MGHGAVSMGNEPLKVLGLAGEYRASSKSGMLVNAALSLAKSQVQKWCFWDLSEQPLPVGEEGVGPTQTSKPSRPCCRSATFFLSSPEYHGTMSGVMKTHGLDVRQARGWQSVRFDVHVGRRHQFQHAQHMRIALRWLHGWPVPEQLAVGHVKEAFDEDGHLVDDSLKQRLESLVNSVLKAAEKLRA